MTISRMQQPRQLYGLGSLVKSVKKGIKGAVKGVKDFAKSDAVKIALLYAGTAGLGSLASGGTLGSLFKASTYAPSNVFGNLGSIFTKKGLGNIVGNIPFADKLSVPTGEKPSFLQTASVFGIGTTVAAALAASGVDTNNPNEMPRDVESLRAYLRRGYLNLNPEASPLEAEQFAIQNTVEYKSDGGRIGYSDGTEDVIIPKKPKFQTEEEVDATTLGRAEIGNPLPGRDESSARLDKLMKMYNTFKTAMPGMANKMASRKLFKDRMKEEYEKLNSFDKEKFDDFLRQNKADGGRIGYQDGTPSFEEYMRERRGIEKKMNMEQMYKEYLEDLRKKKVAEQKTMAAEGGRIGYAMGDSAEDNAMQAAGIMDLPLNQNKAGVTELDLRETGGFIPPVGVKEKADDIPAMLSNNEFVFTADAVRGMGDGNVNLGAQRMYDMMKKLENGGRVA